MSHDHIQWSLVSCHQCTSLVLRKFIETKLVEEIGTGLDMAIAFVQRVMKFF